jgi:hypothetical protein
MIKDICKKFGIENYTINDDGSIDVQGNVDLSDMGLTKLPIKFRNVTGYFYCYNNQLITLEGGPQVVGGDFNCDDNQLITLEGSPGEVGRDFYCYNNQLITLEGGPQRVGGDFNCDDNQLITLEGSPQVVGRDFYCDNNKLITLEGGPQRVGRDFYCSLNQLGLEYKGLYRSEEYSLLIKRINRHKKLKELGI